MIKAKLGIDDKDLKLINLFMLDPNISQVTLSKKLGITQPSVNVRLRKLRAKGILSSVTGIDFEKTDMHLVRVDFVSDKPKLVLKKLQCCSFFVNGFIMSGTRNVSILIVGPDLKTVDNIINVHLRSDKSVVDITTNVVVSSIKPFIGTINLESKCSNQKCEKCNLGKIK